MLFFDLSTCNQAHCLYIMYGLPAIQELQKLQEKPLISEQIGFPDVLSPSQALHVDIDKTQYFDITHYICPFQPVLPSPEMAS